MEQKMKHLELIQEVIKRMANNSFLLKGWTVTLVTGILALASKDRCVLVTTVKTLSIFI